MFKELVVLKINFNIVHFTNKEILPQTVWIKIWCLSLYAHEVCTCIIMVFFFVFFESSNDKFYKVMFITEAG